MRLASIGIALAIGVSTVCLAEGDRDVPLTPAQATEDVAILREALESIHPGLYRYTSREQVDGAFNRLAQMASAGTTDSRLYLEVSRLLALVRCDHTKAEMSEAMEAVRDRTPSYLPFSFRVFGDRVFVDRAPADSPLARGDEVLFINGTPALQLLTETRELVSVDGWTDSTRDLDVEFSGEWLGDGLDVFYPALHGWPREYAIAFLDRKTGAAHDCVVGPVTYPQWEAIATPQQGRFSVNFDTSVAFNYDEATKTGEMSVGTFINYRNTVDPRSVLDPLFRALRENGAERLILDLRNCGGGSTDVPLALLRYFLDSPFVLAARPSVVRTYDFDALRPHLSTWDESVFDTPDDLFTPIEGGFFEIDPRAIGTALAPIEPYEEAIRFSGELIVLCGPANASGATNFLAELVDNDRAVLVGEPTGGTAEGTTAGLLFTLTLPNSGIRVRLPVYRSFNDVQGAVPGYGVQPDVWAVERVQDWLAGRDVALETARALP